MIALLSVSINTIRLHARDAAPGLKPDATKNIHRKMFAFVVRHWRLFLFSGLEPNDVCACRFFQLQAKFERVQMQIFDMGHFLN